MGLKTVQLIEALSHLVVLLDDCTQTHWAAYFRRALHLLKSDDCYGVEVTLGAYGGMGSFNDIAISDPKKAYQLERLSSEIWHLADAIRRLQS
jgi:hypothetical protein